LDELSAILAQARVARLGENNKILSYSRMCNPKIKPEPQAIYFHTITNNIHASGTRNITNINQIFLKSAKTLASFMFLFQLFKLS